jgi:hypothetical protein
MAPAAQANGVKRRDRQAELIRVVGRLLVNQQRISARMGLQEGAKGPVPNGDSGIFSNASDTTTTDRAGGANTRSANPSEKA